MQWVDWEEERKLGGIGPEREAEKDPQLASCVALCTNTVSRGASRANGLIVLGSFNWGAFILSFVSFVNYRPGVGGRRGPVALAVMILLVVVWESSSDDLTQVVTLVVSLETLRQQWIVVGKLSL